MTNAPFAEAIFGSVSRGRADELSDRDILLVGDRYSTLTDRASELKASGWSVACYTWAKLDSLSRSGALFIQHLKDEAEIVADVGVRLQTLLDAFRPKKSYLPEILVNSQLSGVAALRPATRDGALWAADVLYVSLRNFGVLYLASQQRYIFDFVEIVDELIGYGIIHAASRSDIVRLRMAKSLYRTGEQVPPDRAERILAEATRWLPAEWFPGEFVKWSPMKILRAAKTMGSSSPPYHRLRNLERTYLALRSVCPDATDSAQMHKLLQWIENPRSYAAIAGYMEAEMMTFLKEAASESACLRVSLAAS
jgi:hypothetical protein